MGANTQPRTTRIRPLDIRRIAVVFGPKVNTVRIFGQADTRPPFPRWLFQKRTDCRGRTTGDEPLSRVWGDASRLRFGVLGRSGVISRRAAARQRSLRKCTSAASGVGNPSHRKISR